jgi:TonB family protein
MRLASVVTAAFLLGPLAVPVLPAQDEPVTAGSGGVSVPKRTKSVLPDYPPTAQAQGIRGIVILELIIDKEGKVAEARVIRSVPGLDEAALAAARQWTYEVTKVNAKPVSVRLTVPITFAMKLPEMTRQDGIPELRQGIAPPFPPDGSGPATVVAEVSLDADGRVSEAKVAKGEAPWTNALLAALRTWRFAAEAGEATVSFRIQADFIPGERKDPPKVRLRLDGLQRSESMVGALAPSASPTTPATPPAAAPEAAPEAAPSPTGVPPATPAPAAGPATAGEATLGIAATGTAPPAASADPAPAAPSGQAAPPPPVEVITAPPPPPPPPEVESGASAVRDVVLEAGVPDLAKGRRPVPPPLARMAGTSGVVEVQFSVSAAGTCLVQAVSGPDLLKIAAEQTVTSWQFRRTQAHRLFLAAVFTYEGDRVTAVVRPQPPAAAPQALAQPQP